MTEFNENINQKNSILLSRNRTVALVVGAGGFLGSHLTDKLLDKNIQVVGIDNLQTGKRENLQEASENKDFHLLIESAQNLSIDLPRLDYLFITAKGDWDLGKVLALFKKHKSKCLFISSIDLYDQNNNMDDLKELKKQESRIAKFASENNLNARVLRLGPVFGPRMNFNTKDPLVKLINQALTGSLQEDVTLEFSSRALYILDAVDLIVRTNLSGSTAQKIFDGVNPMPVKVAEIKQVLLDPIWYETRDFIPSELPPWITPNLQKTMKFLNWSPKARFVSSLKETLAYFKDNEIAVPKMEDVKEESEIKEANWDEEKKAALESLKQKDKKEEKKGRVKAKFSLPWPKIYLAILIGLISYAIIWPLFLFGWGIITYYQGFSDGVKNLQKGEFEKSLANIRQAKIGAEAAKSVYQSLEPVKQLGVFTNEFTIGDKLVSISDLSVSSLESAVVGVQNLLEGVKAVTGEATESPSGYFNRSLLEMDSANKNLLKTQVVLKDPDFTKRLPPYIRQRIDSLSEKLSLYSNLVGKAQVLSSLLPSLVATQGSKDYLILLQNNMELRPTGGFIGSFAKVSFEGGKLKKIDVNDIYAIDGALTQHVEPPIEIKTDLGQNNWYLRDSNWEPDFPTSAKRAEWFYTKETGDRVEGVIALDVSAMEDLLSATGPLNLSDYKQSLPSGDLKQSLPSGDLKQSLPSGDGNEKITSENLFEKAVSHAEMSFFPGTQAKKSFLTALTNEAFNKIFFLPQNNWQGIISSLARSLDQKHISIYLNDPKLFSYIASEGWAHAIPRVSEEKTDFLSIVEANLGANKANYYLDRNLNLETKIGKDGEVLHRLRINYTNRSPSDVFPAGKYKNRMRIYLPFESKLIRVLWGEKEITPDVKAFTDYGRSGYSMLLELNPKEQKTLVLDYTVPIKLEFKEGKAKYRLDIIKQAGILKDPLQWTISYPISYKLTSSQTQKISPQEQKITTDLSTDKTFEVEFSK